jgi:hypothetical protein
VKVIALPDPEEEGDDRDYVDAMSRLNLRQRRALERKMAKEQQELEEKAKNRGSDETDDNENEDGHQPQGSLDAVTEEDVVDDDIDDYPDYGDDENDPFLKAIGGKDKLLTGEAYQRKLLEQQRDQ